MGKWNFDVIFEGSMKEQTRKAGIFANGLKRLELEATKDYAHAILYGHSAGVALQRIDLANEAYSDFGNDPRTAAISKWVAEQERAKRAQGLREALDGVVEEILGG